MVTNGRFTFKSRTDIEAVKKKRERINVRYALVGLGIGVVMLVPDIIGAIIWGKTPVMTFMESKYRWDFLIILGLVSAVCFYCYDKTKMKQREREIWRAARAADAFARAELLLDSGLNQGSVRMVRKALEKLDTIRESFAEMEEYRELVSNGRAWLREHEGD